ncbi:MAG: cell division protein ZapE [Chloroflexi bacterium]|nr:MAG: cell division protein ZapE [Chloroflexota bacterium]
MQQYFDGVAPDGKGIAAPTLDSFAVPPRFRSATFDTYQPAAGYPSQRIASERVAAAVRALQERGSGSTRLFGRVLRRPEPQWRGLYLDGGFGVGKTHLIAAAWHAAEGLDRAYLSFQELTYVVGALGMARTLDLLGAADLICLDEFELDDPGNTMLATSFVRGALERGARVIATSNTLPNELGQGRFSAHAFQREIGQLAASFDTLRIDGEDYRHRHFSADARPMRLLANGSLPNDGIAVVGEDWSRLLRSLAALHPIHYARIAASLPPLWLRDVAPLPDQDAALRFVHFADKLYDYRVPLYLSGEVTLESLFPSTFGYGPFERKFRRCRSRLYEMLTEPIEAPITVRAAAADD